MSAKREANEPGTFDVSIVVALADHEAAIAALLTALRALAQELRGRFEVVLVDDASSTPIEADAARWRTQFGGFVIARHDKRKGRGAAVRTGVLLARGDLVLVVDPDLAVPLGNARHLLDALRRGADIASVSRNVERGAADAKSFLERAAETTVMRLSHLMVPVGVRDCFSGLAAYRSRAVKKIAQRSRVSGPAYPVEWFALAQYLGFQTVEIPADRIGRRPLGRRKGSALALLKGVWGARRLLKHEDFAMSLEPRALLSETSFHKLDRELSKRR